MDSVFPGGNGACQPQRANVVDWWSCASPAGLPGRSTPHAAPLPRSTPPPSPPLVNGVSTVPADDLHAAARYIRGVEPSVQADLHVAPTHYEVVPWKTLHNQAALPAAASPSATVAAPAVRVAVPMS